MKALIMCAKGDTTLSACVRVKERLSLPAEVIFNALQSFYVLVSFLFVSCLPFIWDQTKVWYLVAPRYKALHLQALTDSPTVQSTESPLLEDDGTLCGVMSCSQPRLNQVQLNQISTESKKFLLFLFLTVHLCSAGYTLNSHQHYHHHLPFLS